MLSHVKQTRSEQLARAFRLVTFCYSFNIVQKCFEDSNCHRLVAEKKRGFGAVLARASRDAHEQARNSYIKRIDTDKSLKVIEEEIDKVVATIYGISLDTELEEIKKCLAILRA